MVKNGHFQIWCRFFRIFGSTCSIEIPKWHRYGSHLPQLQSFFGVKVHHVSQLYLDVFSCTDFSHLNHKVIANTHVKWGYVLYSGWFQPDLKNIESECKLVHLPQIGVENKKCFKPPPGIKGFDVGVLPF